MTKRTRRKVDAALKAKVASETVPERAGVGDLRIAPVARHRHYVAAHYPAQAQRNRRLIEPRAIPLLRSPFVAVPDIAGAPPQCDVHAERPVAGRLAIRPHLSSRAGGTVSAPGP